MHRTGYATSRPTPRPATALVESISLQDTVYLLRGELGNLRNWNSWLCDGNKQGAHRGPATLHGHTLRPCARVNGAPPLQPGGRLRLHPSYSGSGPECTTCAGRNGSLANRSWQALAPERLQGQRGNNPLSQQAKRREADPYRADQP